MNKLKAISSGEIYNKIEYEGSCITDDLYYPKPEADKVIAELKADYKEACDRLQTANLIKDEQLAAARHHKYKRCLAMARMCEERSSRYDALQERYGLDWGREIELNYRWHERWLELAEKFKELK